MTEVTLESTTLSEDNTANSTIVTTTIIEQFVTQLEEEFRNISKWNKSDPANSENQFVFTKEMYLNTFYALVIISNLLFIYIILKNSLNRSPFYLSLLHVTIFSTIYTICGILAPSSFSIPNYGYHIFTNTKHITMSFETILFTAFIFDWFVQSVQYCQNIIIVFWIMTISYIFLGCVAVSCGDRLYYSFYILPFISYTILLTTFSVILTINFKKFLEDEKYKTRLILVFVYILSFLPDYLLLLFDVSLYYYHVFYSICPILLYGHGFINIIFVLLLDPYLRMHVGNIFKSSKSYQQNAHFPVENA